jgi:hypothetical protein
MAGHSRLADVGDHSRMMAHARWARDEPWSYCQPSREAPERMAAPPERDATHAAVQDHHESTDLLGYSPADETRGRNPVQRPSPSGSTPRRLERGIRVDPLAVRSADANLEVQVGCGRASRRPDETDYFALSH